MRCSCVGLGTIALVIACSAGEADDRGGIPYASGSPVSGADGDDDGHEPPFAESSSGALESETGSITTAPPPTTTIGPGDASSDDGSSGALETTGEPVDETSSSTGEAQEGDPGTLPGSGPWSACVDTSCGPGYGCLQATMGGGGVCTVGCIAPGDASACPAAPGDIVAPICILAQGQPVCALDCTGGLTCPSGSTCSVETDDLGSIEVCL